MGGGVVWGNKKVGVVSMLCNTTQQIKNWVEHVLLWEILQNVLLFG